MFWLTQLLLYLQILQKTPVYQTTLVCKYKLVQGGGLTWNDSIEHIKKNEHAIFFIRKSFNKDICKIVLQ